MFTSPLSGKRPSFLKVNLHYRSLKMDRWKLKELKQMELGGNKNAHIFFEKNGMYVDGKPNHKAAQLAKYKSDLLKKVEIEIGAHKVEHQGSAVFNTLNLQHSNYQSANSKTSVKDNVFEFD